jgi:hypothetical protein
MEALSDMALRGNWSAEIDRSSAASWDEREVE